MTSSDANWTWQIVDSEWLGLTDGIIRAMAEALGKERAMEAISPLLDDADGLCRECVAVRARCVLDGRYGPMRDSFYDDLPDDEVPVTFEDNEAFVDGRMESDADDVLTVWMLDMFSVDLGILADFGRSDLAERTLGYIADAMEREDTRMRAIVPDKVGERAQWMREHAGCGDIETAFLGKAS